MKSPRDKYVIMADVVTSPIATIPRISAYITILSGKDGDFSDFSTSYYAIGMSSESAKLLAALRRILLEEQHGRKPPYNINPRMQLMRFYNISNQWTW